MKRLFALILTILMILALTACGKKSTSPASTSSSLASASASESSSTESSEEDSSSVSGIPGSGYTDVTLGMKKFGMKEPELKNPPADMKSECAYTASQSADNADLDAKLSYDLEIDDDMQVISGTFNITWDATVENTVFVASAKNYLGFAASMPYDTAQQAEAMQWVQSQLTSSANGKGVDKVFGDAKYHVQGVKQSSGYTAFELDIQKAA